MILTSKVRYCCEGANICPKCWKFMTNAAIVLKNILTKEFGFKHILFVYSGPPSPIYALRPDSPPKSR